MSILVVFSNAHFHSSSLTVEIIRLDGIAHRLEVADRHVQTAMVLAILKLIRLVCGTIGYDDSNLVTFAKDQDLCFNFTHDLEILWLVVLANDAQLAVSCEPGIADIVDSLFLSRDELSPRPRPWVQIAPRAVR